MSAKPVLPSLDGDLAPRKRLDLKAIKPSAADDESVSENSRRIGSEWGAQTSLPSAPIEQPKPPLALASLRIEVPEYLDRELALKAAEQRVTKQFLVMKALQAAGYRLDEADLVEDKRKVKARRKV
jgi:hypothetical protein